MELLTKISHRPTPWGLTYDSSPTWVTTGWLQGLTRLGRWVRLRLWKLNCRTYNPLRGRIFTSSSLTEAYYTKPYKMISYYWIITDNHSKKVVVLCPFMEEPSLDQRSEVTCPRLHSLLGPELGFLTCSSGLYLCLASEACGTDLTHGIISS